MLTEGGYLLIIKPLDDDRSWAVWRMLVECYLGPPPSRGDRFTCRPCGRPLLYGETGPLCLDCEDGGGNADVERGAV